MTPLLALARRLGWLVVHAPSAGTLWPGVAPLPMHAAPARARDPPSRPGESRALQLRTDAVVKAHIEGHIRKAFDIATRRDASVRASSESDLELLRQKCQALNPPRLAPHAGFQIQAVPDDYAQTRVCDYTDGAIAAAHLRLPRALHVDAAARDGGGPAQRARRSR